MRGPRPAARLQQEDRHVEEQSTEEQRRDASFLPAAAELYGEGPGTDKKEQRQVEDQQYRLGAEERGIRHPCAPRPAAISRSASSKFKIRTTP